MIRVEAVPWDHGTVTGTAACGPSGGEMSEQQDSMSMEDSYDEFPRIEQDFGRLLDVSLEPRGPGSLFDLAARLEIVAGSKLVDVGCGEGDDAVALHRRFD